MSDYELIDLLFSDVIGIQTTVMNFVTVLSAFLVVGYLVADKLDKTIVIIIVALFTLVTFYQTLATIGLGHDFEGLIGVLGERADRDPSALGWQSATMSIREFGLPIMRFTPTFVVVFGYIGGLIFFFRQRHLGRLRSERRE